MSVRGAKNGKTSHEQKPVRGAAGGKLFLKAVKGQTPVRGAAGGLLFLKARGSGKTKLRRPTFEHSARSGRR